MDRDGLNLWVKSPCAIIALSAHAKELITGDEFTMADVTSDSPVMRFPYCLLDNIVMYIFASGDSGNETNWTFVIIRITFRAFIRSSHTSQFPQVAAASQPML